MQQVDTHFIDNLNTDDRFALLNSVRALSDLFVSSDKGIRPDIGVNEAVGSLITWHGLLRESKGRNLAHTQGEQGAGQ